MLNTLVKNAKSSQQFVVIDEIREGIIVLKNKGLRAVMMASSINFALKSNDEQDAIIAQFQNLLNTLDFSLQFFVQSRHLNIEPYLEMLNERLKTETNELLRIQTTEYIEFIKSLVDNTDIVSKIFYIVVPFNPVTVQMKTGLLGKFMGGAKKNLPQGKFEEYRAQIFQRVDVVRQGLIRFGVKAVVLNTEEVVELFYGLYNPGEKRRTSSSQEENTSESEVNSY